MSSIMWNYIDQEQEALTRLMRCDAIRSFAAGVSRELQAVYITAHGSSFNAAIATAELVARIAGLRVYAMVPGNFCNNYATLCSEDRSKTLVVAISQTGTSSGVIEALELARKWGFTTVGITDVSDSPVGQEAGYMLPLLCGAEDSNAKTKGYSATLLLLMRLAVELGLARGTISEKEAEVINGELAGMIEIIPAVRDRCIAWCRENNFGASIKNMYVLGSGINFGTAQEGQLKLMETICIPTMFNDIGEFSHGMHRSITASSNVLILRSKDEYAELSAQIYRYLQGITEHVWMIDSTGEKAMDGHCLCVDCFPQTQSLLLTTLAVQVLSVYAPEKLGLDPNRNAHDDFTEVVGTRVKRKESEGKPCIE